MNQSIQWNIEWQNYVNTNAQFYNATYIISKKGCGARGDPATGNSYPCESPDSEREPRSLIDLGSSSYQAKTLNDDEQEHEFDYAEDDRADGLGIGSRKTT